MKINLTHTIKIDDGENAFDILIQGKNIKMENWESVSGDIKFVTVRKSIQKIEPCSEIYDTDEG